MNMGNQMGFDASAAYKQVWMNMFIITICYYHHVDLNMLIYVCSSGVV